MLLPARIQMAFTLGSHIFIACLGVGLPILLLFAEWRYLRTGDEGWKFLARRWSKAFAVLFAVGAVSGTVLSFELGLLWPNFMGTFGSVIGLPFTLEAFAFFLEAIFIAIYLYGWDRLSPKVHFLCGIPVAVSGFLSAWFVVTANAWMNSPSGFRMVDGKVVDVDPLAAMMNAATFAQTTHMIIAAYMVTGFVVAAIYAWHRLRGRNTLYHKRAMALGLVMGVVFAPLQILAGDWSAKMVAKTQPVKLAAMENHYETQRAAPIKVMGIVEIPGGLSFLAYGDWNAEVMGLNDVLPENRPPVMVVYLAFQLMVACGMFFLMLAVWTGITFVRRRGLPSSRLFLWALVMAGPMVVMALEAGWVVTEVGRQPWIVYGVMRTADAVTNAPGIWLTLFIAIAIYTVLLVGTIFALRFLSRRPFPEAMRGN